MLLLLALSCKSDLPAADTGAVGDTGALPALDTGEPADDTAKPPIDTDSGQDGDSGDGGDSGDSGETGAPPLEPYPTFEACPELASPYTIDSPEALFAANAHFKPDNHTFQELGELLTAVAEPDGCPAVTTPTDGTRVFTGPCTTDEGWAFEGVAVWEQDPKAPADFEVTFTSFSLAADSYELSADGRYAIRWSGTDHEVEAELAYAVAHDGSYQAVQGSWQRDQVVVESTPWFTAEGWVEVVGEGELCAALEVTGLEACPEEGQGALWIGGLGEGVAWFDGDVACDECALVAIDGAVVGEHCFGE